MPRSALEVVQANNAAFSAMDVDAMLELYAPDAQVLDRRRVSMGTFTGHDELRAYYLSIFHSAETLRETLEVLGERDGVVAAHCELWGRLAGDVAGSGITVTYGLAIWVADGRITRLEIAEDPEHARELAGLA
jgi:ketosteroid isomerase-like protein